LVPRGVGGLGKESAKAAADGFSSEAVVLVDEHVLELPHINVPFPGSAM
jgi:hypothetical protein